MAILQTTWWICDECGYHVALTGEVFFYSDPVIVPPEEGWDYDNGDGDRLLCPNCNRVGPSKEIGE